MPTGHCPEILSIIIQGTLVVFNGNDRVNIHVFIYSRPNKLGLQDYSSDFEEDTESGFTSSNETSSESSSSSESSGSEDLASKTGLKGKVVEEERKLDSGNYDLKTTIARSDVIKQSQLNYIKEAISRENSMFKDG